MTVGTRWQVFSHALAFVIGFSLVFVALGASVAFVGYAINAFLPTFVKIGGVILIVFGLQVLGVFHWIAERIRARHADTQGLGKWFVRAEDGLAQLMYTEGRVQAKVDRKWGYLSSALMGVFFSAGWIPCVGPVLAAIYLLASDTATVGQGALMLLVYSAGLGIPFLLTGAAFGTVAPALRRMNRHLNIVSRITGVFLLIVGVLLFMDRLALLSTWLISKLGTGLASFDGGLGGASAVTLPIAFIAGLLSFLSPCVLPLIPAYVGYLSGTAVATTGAPVADSKSAA